MHTHIIDLDADVTLRYIEVRVGVRRYAGVYKPNPLVRGAIQSFLSSGVNDVQTRRLRYIRAIRKPTHPVQCIRFDGSLR